jgi:membrane protein YdbS with pleckstrin-like domain
MRNLEKRYSKSERIVLKARFSGWVFLREIFIAALLGAVIAVLWVFGASIEALLGLGAGSAFNDANLRWTVLAAGLFSLVLLILHALVVYRKELIMTEDKVAYRYGILFVRSIVLPVTEIKIVESTQNIFQHIFNLGHITVITDAEKPYHIKNVSSPEKLARRIMKQTTAVKSRESLKTLQLQLAPASDAQKRFVAR